MREKTMPTKKKNPQPEQADFHLSLCESVDGLHSLAEMRGRYIEEMKSLLNAVERGDDVLTDKKWKKRTKAVVEGTFLLDKNEMYTPLTRANV